MQSVILNKVNDIIKSDPLLKMLPVQVTALMKGSVTISMLVDNEKHTNSEGFIYNGILFTLVDLVIGVAILTSGYLVKTNDLHVNLVPNVVQTDMVIALGKIIIITDHLIVVEAEIKDEKQRVIAVAQGSYII